MEKEQRSEKERESGRKREMERKMRAREINREVEKASTG